MTDWTRDSFDPVESGPGDPVNYLRSGRRLQARAMGAALAGLPRALTRVAGGVTRLALWRAPRSGNCLNC